MNIGFFTDSYTPQLDGVTMSIKLFRAELERQGHTVYVFAPYGVKSETDTSTIPPDDDDHVFRFRSIDSVFVPGYPLAIPMSFRASRKIPTLKLDIVHSHSHIFLGLLADLVALAENVPQVYTYHTFYPEYIKNYFREKVITPQILKKYDTFYCNRADTVIAPSKKFRDLLKAADVESNIEILPTGIDLREFSAPTDTAAFRARHQIDANARILLYVGRIAQEKNLDFLIRVMNILVRKEQNVVMLWAGDGKDRAFFEKKIHDLALERFIKILGFLPRPETLSAFAASDIFVFASKTDTQGLVLLEAAAAGKPIVMLEDPGLGDVVTSDNGFLVSEDPEAFAENISRLLREKDLYAKMAANSKRKAMSFSIEEQTKKLLAIYTGTQSTYRNSSWRLKLWSTLNKKFDIPSWARVDQNIKKLFK